MATHIINVSFGLNNYIKTKPREKHSYGDIKHVAWDEDPTKARLKAESKFHEILAAAAISELPVHAAIMFTSDGVPVMNQKYVHAISQVEPEPEEDTPVEGE